MLNRFLLYIDVLGFSELVLKKPEIIPRILEALDNSPAYSHPEFTAIQFSDTLLVFNNEDVTSDYDKHYCAMYLCEFAQHLQYSLLSSNIFIRAVVTYGPLEDSKCESHGALKNIRAIWGNLSSKLIIKRKVSRRSGTFIDETVQPTYAYF